MNPWAFLAITASLTDLKVVSRTPINYIDTMSLLTLLFGFKCMNYWLLCLPREDLEHCMKKKVFGLARKHTLGQVAKGDRIACCVTKGDWKVIALGTALSDYYIDDTDVFLKTGSFSHRFDFTSDKLPKEREFDIISVIDQLSFVTNLVYWAVFFRNGIAKMSKKDWELLNSKISQ